MDEIQGTYRDGRIELESSVDWPDGIHVTVHPHIDDGEPPGTRLPLAHLADGTILSWSDTPGFREALIAQMDRREPVELTPDEEAEWCAARHWIREHTLATVRREMGL